MSDENKSQVLTQIQTDVSLLAFMTAVAMFFNGLLLTRFESLNLLIKIPVSFLAISTFSFLFSALILANTSQNVIDGNSQKAGRHLIWGYTISEYLGIYLFVLSVPLIINVLTNDLYLRITVLSAAITGLIVYQFMGFSILERHFPKSYKFFSILVVLLSVGMFVAQISGRYFTQTAVIFLIFLIVVTLLAPRKDFL